MDNQMTNPKDPYGVPTGVVPRVHTNGYQRTEPIKPVADPVAKAVDDYLLMERKARAWDELRSNWRLSGQLGLVAMMDALVHPAQDAA